MNEIWVVTLTVAMSITSIAIVAGVLWWHQRKVAAEAAEWGRQVVTAQDEERSRLAADLHDDVVQRLSIALSHLEGGMPGGSETAATVVRGVADDVRAIAHALHPTALAKLGLIDALSDLVDACNVPGSPAVMLEVQGDPPPLPDLTRLALFRVSQEALQNALRHARASTIVISARVVAGMMTVSIHDDGVGFGERGLATPGFGLRSMRERMRSVGGRLHLESPVGTGTTVRAEVTVS